MEMQQMRVCSEGGCASGKMSRQCKETCEFVNVTCYIPECGFTGSDDRLK